MCTLPTKCSPRGRSGRRRFFFLTSFRQRSSLFMGPQGSARDRSGSWRVRSASTTAHSCVPSGCGAWRARAHTTLHTRSLVHNRSTHYHTAELPRTRYNNFRPSPVRSRYGNTVFNNSISAQHSRVILHVRAAVARSLRNRVGVVREGCKRIRRRSPVRCPSTW